MARLLIVDDERIVAMHLELLVEQLGHEVVGSFAHGEGALDALEEPIDVDLALVDVRLAGTMDGIELAGQLWERARVPSMFVSANADLGHRRRADGPWSRGWLSKPFNRVRLIQALELALVRRSQA